ncbi:MAG: hypothetical protein JW717_04020 [Marinilabiliaceae bacterium]|nr:hypothetical protein [Marinilabiliaceae bacterium]
MCIINIPIEDLVPQRNPFLFVDEVIAYNNNSIITRFEVKDDNILLDRGVLLETALVENMAQSAAALEGFNARVNGCEVKVGFIGSVKKFNVFEQVKLGDVLETEIKVITNAIGVNVVEGDVKVNERVIANCILNIFLKED